MKFFNQKLKGSEGFTLAELVVSVSIFATTITMMMVLLNYTLKIQRKTEALRQASQGMRNFAEFLVKEIRNGRIDYGVTNGTTLQTTKSPCPNPSLVGNNTFGVLDTGRSDSRLPMLNISNEQECFFWAKDDGLGGITEASEADINAGSAKHIGLSKNNVAAYEKLNPQNMTVDYLRFYIRPLCDPYTLTCTGGLAETQPFVILVARFVVRLGTGEVVYIPYQTTITIDDYAIPRT